MYNLYIIIITALVIFLLYRFYIAINGKVKNLTITSLFCVFYIVFVLVGSALLNCYKFEAEIEFGVYNRPEVLFKVWLYALLGIFSIFIGFVLSHISNKGKPYKYYQYNLYCKDITYSTNVFTKKSYNTIFCCFLVVLAITILYRSTIGRFPLESIFQGLSPTDLILLRSDATNGYSGKLYRYAMFMDELPLFMLILVSIIRKGKSSMKWNVLFLLLIFYNVFYALSTLQKAPIIKLLILGIIIYLYIHKSIPRRALIIVGSCITALIVLMYIFFMGSEDSTVLEIIKGAAHRIFVGSIIPFYWYIIYVEQKGFLYGASFPNPAGLLPFEHVPLTKEIALIGQSSGDAVGSMPTVFIGEMYANFGVIGIVFFGILFGFVLQSLDFYFARRLSKTKGVITSSLFIYLVFYFTKYSETALSPIILDTSLYVVLVFYYIYKNGVLRHKCIRENRPHYS